MIPTGIFIVLLICPEIMDTTFSATAIKLNINSTDITFKEATIDPAPLHWICLYSAEFYDFYFRPYFCDPQAPHQ